MIKRLLYETEKKATLESVREIRIVLQRLLSLKHVDEGLSNRICLAFAEAATNCVKHSHPSPTTIQVSLSQDGAYFYVMLMNDGQVWDMTEQRYQGIDSLFQDNESGRGLELVNAFSDKVEYQPNYADSFHCLTMSWCLPGKSQQPRILIIEDERVAQNLYYSYLSEDYQVDIVDDGMQALAKLKTKSYELLLSDINMPGMDGISFREQILSQKKEQLVSFIFLTAAENTQLIERANVLGVDDYLQKPVNKSQLLQSVDRAINRSSQFKKAMGEMIDERLCSALLPQIPHDIPYWQCHQQYSHSGRGGGDIFHYYPFIDDTGLDAGLIMLADVEGHDETAKFFSHAFSGYFRGMIQGYLDGVSAAFSENTQSIEYLMQKISDGIYTDKLLNQSTITLLLVTIHSGGKVRIVCAGHPPPLRLSAEGIDQLEVGGLIPGLIENTQYQMLEMDVKPSERLVLYTDGLLESKTPTQHFVESEILQQLNLSRTQPLDRAARLLVDHFKQQVDPALQDDATLVLLQTK
ncbi:SpoIIE family protein phosphatase [Photobacterium nomapromontoriensis]|uniref:SpoIIE family protein phosphatase n=1 Tax=Photobacterium nomapromontoriensis TaxID=2910237 RepID=UPI003D0DDB90